MRLNCTMKTIKEFLLTSHLLFYICWLLAFILLSSFVSVFHGYNFWINTFRAIILYLPLLSILLKSIIKFRQNIKIWFDNCSITKLLILACIYVVYLLLVLYIRENASSGIIGSIEASFWTEESFIAKYIMCSAHILSYNMDVFYYLLFLPICVYINMLRHKELKNFGII